jgi:hypothetical protein
MRLGCSLIQLKSEKCWLTFASTQPKLLSSFQDGSRARGGQCCEAWRQGGRERCQMQGPYEATGRRHGHVFKFGRTTIGAPFTRGTRTAGNSSARRASDAI